MLHRVRNHDTSTVTSVITEKGTQMANKLPPELLEHLFLYVLNPLDLFALRVICRQWHAIITNERFLTLYFHKRQGSHTMQQLQWVDLDWVHVPLSLARRHRLALQIPANLQGSGAIEISSHDSGHRADFSSRFDPLSDYSIGMWLKSCSNLKSITFRLQSNGFSLKFIMTRRYIKTHCSRMDGLGAGASIPFSWKDWIYIVLTKESSSNFVFWINGRKYPLDPIHGALSYEQFETNLIFDEPDGYIKLDYKDKNTNIKFYSTVEIADVQILPYSLTQHEIKAVIAQSTSMDKLDMARYTLERWANRHWYDNYLIGGCVLM